MHNEHTDYRAVLFDMDGVLADTAESVVKFWRELAGEQGGAISDEELVAHVYGRTADDTLDALFPLFDLEARRGVHTRMHTYEANLIYKSIAGAAALLTSLQRCGIPAVLVTSGSMAKVERVVEHLGIARLLSAYVTSADITKGKPDPEPYLVGASKAGAPATQCVAVEDATGGVRSAVAAGALCIGIGNAFMAPALLEAGAHVVVPDLTAIRVREVGRSAEGFNIEMEIGEGTRLPFAGKREAHAGR